MSKSITFNDIVKGLKTLGLTKGDKVMVHSALSSFGTVKGGADTVIDALLAIVGSTGTVLMPTFGNSDPIFNVKKSETNLGIIAQTFWRRKNAFRSRHSAASIAAIGNDAKHFVENHENANTAHGKDTPYMKLVKQNGKVLLLGVDIDRMTLLHSVETLAKLPYLRPITKSFVDANGKTRTKTWPYFPGPHRNFIGLQSWLRSKRLVKETVIGACHAKLFDTATLFEALQERLRNEPDLFISDNPNLPDGISQKADILKAHWKRQTFTLVADSQFAGQYLEEIIENCKHFGIDTIVLSFVNNIAWAAIPEKTRKWYLQGLRQANIKIAALRLPFMPTEDMAKIASEVNTDTIIVPSTTDISKIKPVKKRTKILIENTHIDSASFVEKIKTLGKTLPSAKAAFNPLAFVEAGENPFLKSYYKTGIKSRIGALYINDGFATGQRSNLEEGLSEIKELISILLCRSFDGLFILQGHNCSDFANTVKKFTQILEEVQ
ncbi:MAG: AAC(3) family N-acetyltransferase [Phycisphaerae bacterium]|jgi:aminoglycoside 3-N-acetyltransferase